MCVRYVFFRGDSVKEDFAAEPLYEIQPSFNFAPTDVVPAIVVQEGRRVVVPLQWGLVPPWAKDPSIGSRLVNARGETLHEKPSFRGAFKSKRCVIPMNGFYEWTGAKGARRAFYVYPADGRTLAVGGLWEAWESPDGYLETCTVVTTPSCAEVDPLNDRMPLILDADRIGAWLDPTLRDPLKIQPLIGPWPDGRLETHEVDKRVGNPREEGARLIVPVAPTTLF